MIGLGAAADGIPRQTGFDITAASEVMAVLALSSSLQDMGPGYLDMSLRTFLGGGDSPTGRPARRHPASRRDAQGPRCGSWAINLSGPIRRRSPGARRRELERYRARAGDRRHGRQGTEGGDLRQSITSGNALPPNPYAS